MIEISAAGTFGAGNGCAKARLHVHTAYGKMQAG